MRTAMENLIIEIDNLIKIGLFDEEHSQIIKNYVKYIGMREEEMNIKNAWLHGIYSGTSEKDMTAEKYFSKMYNQNK